MVSSKELKPEELEDIQKTHGLLIPQELHILHNKYSLESPLLVNSSVPLYTMSLIAIGNVLALVGTVFSSSKPSRHQLLAQSVVVVFLYLDKSVLLDILI